MRKFYKITDLDGGNPYSIPQTEYSESPISIASRLAMAPVIAQHGSFDLHGDLRSPLEEAKAQFRFLLSADCARDLQPMIDELLTGVYGTRSELGKRKLWRWEEGDQSNRRWAFARPTARPLIGDRTLVISRHLEASVEMVLNDPVFYQAVSQGWLSANGYTPLERLVNGEPTAPDNWFASFTVTTSPYDFTLENIGDFETRRVIFRLEALASNGWTNPAINNFTNGYNFSTPTDGVNTSYRLNFNAAPGLGRAQLSVNGGSSWADDTLNLVLPAGQAVLMELAPGENNLRITSGGTPNFLLMAHYAHAFKD